MEEINEDQVINATKYLAGKIGRGGIKAADVTGDALSKALAWGYKKAKLKTEKNLRRRKRNKLLNKLEDLKASGDTKTLDLAKNALDSYSK